MHSWDLVLHLGGIYNWAEINILSSSSFLQFRYLNLSFNIFILDKVNCFMATLKIRKAKNLPYVTYFLKTWLVYNWLPSIYLMSSKECLYFCKGVSEKCWCLVLWQYSAASENVRRFSAYTCKQLSTGNHVEDVMSLFPALSKSIQCLLGNRFI